MAQCGFIGMGRMGGPMTRRLLARGFSMCVNDADQAAVAALAERYNEPWMTQNAISTYGDMWIIAAALEKAGAAVKEAVAQAIRDLDIEGGPARNFSGDRIKFDEHGRRPDAGLVIIQWQSGVPVTVYPPDAAVAAPIWPVQ